MGGRRVDWDIGGWRCAVAWNLAKCGLMKERLGFLGWVLRLIAIGYPVALLLTWLAFRFIGERWWPLAVLLYLPRLGFALPLPVVVLAVVLARRRGLLIVQLASVLLLIFPIMGLSLGLGRSGVEAGAYRVLSYNIDSGRRGEAIILRQMQAARADLFLLQEAAGIDGDLLQAGLPGYHFHQSGQFWTASRYPIDEVVVPPKLVVRGVARSPRFIRYRIITPRGPLQVYSIHPISPREGLDEIRGEGLLYEFRKKRLFDPRGPGLVLGNAALRAAQLEAISTDASHSALPVIIAGDTNLPGMSWLLARWFGGFKEGFAEVGRGFGYTFPAPKHPWMRIDRVFAGPGLRFLRFDVDRTPGSDHRAVIADIEMTRP
jgi:endonuclease/exonuclease/phosphatase (EEP) superfamily protein YafD